MSGVNLSFAGTVSYGSAAFQMDNCIWREEPVVQPAWGRTATRITATIDGFIDDTNATAFAAKLAALSGLNIDGGNLIVTGVGSPGPSEYTIAAATCLEGGPNVGCTISPGSGPLHRRVSFKVWALVPYATLLDSFTLSYRTRPDGLLVFSRSGDVWGANAGLYITGTLLPSLNGSYAPPAWSVESDYAVTGSAEGDRARYQFTATQQSSNLPGSSDIQAVQGVCTITQNTDEQKRVTTTTSFDLLLNGSGDITNLHNSLRPTGATVIRESMAISSIRESRLRSTFTQEAGDGGSNLLTWQNSFELMGDDQTYEMKTFVGADPFLVQRPGVLTRAVLSGSATSLNSPAAFPGAIEGVYLEEPAQETTDLSDGYHFVTRWRYAMVADPDNDALAGFNPTTLGRPS